MDVPPSVSPEAVLDHIGPRRRPHRPARQRRAGDAARRHRGRRRPARRACASTRCTRCTTGRTSHGRVRRPPAPRLLLPVARHPAALRRRHHRPRAEPLQRDAAPSCADAPTTRSCWRRPRRPTATATSRSASTPTTCRSFIGRARFFLEANAADAADVRSQPGPRQPGRRVVRGRLPARRGAARRARRDRPAHRRPRRRADPRRRHDPDRHRRDPQRHAGRRCATTATSACTPSCCPTA